MSETVFNSGAVRQSCPYDFASLPMVGLLGLARTAFEGGEKYGRFNYHKGMAPHELINHVMAHLAAYSMGDRSEPHAFHAAWGCLVLGQQGVLNPELEKESLLGPGMRMHEEMLALQEKNSPIFKERRNSGYDFSWKVEELPIIKEMLQERNPIIEEMLESKITEGPSEEHNEYR